MSGPNGRVFPHAAADRALGRLRAVLRGHLGGGTAQGQRAAVLRRATRRFADARRADGRDERGHHLGLRQIDRERISPGLRLRPGGRHRLHDLLSQLLRRRHHDLADTPALAVQLPVASVGGPLRPGVCATVPSGRRLSAHQRGLVQHEGDIALFRTGRLGAVLVGGLAGDGIHGALRVARRACAPA